MTQCLTSALQDGMGDRKPSNRMDIGDREGKDTHQLGLAATVDIHDERAMVRVDARGDAALEIIGATDGEYNSQT